MKYKLTFKASESGPASEAEFPDFQPDMWNLLADFMAYSDEAHRTRFAKELPSYKPSFHFTNSGIVRNTGVVPDEEALGAFLHKYRPVLLHKEPTEFTNVCSHLVRHISHPSFSRLVKAWKEQYSGKALRELFTIQQGDVALTGQTFLENYLNAFEYHRDKKLQGRLTAFAQTFEPDARRGLVTLLLTFKFSAVSSLRQMIREMQRLRREQEALNKASDTNSGSAPGALV